MIARNGASIRFMEERWRHSLGRIETSIGRLTERIEKARREGTRVNPDWLRRQRAYRDLQSQVLREAERYSSTVSQRLRTDVSAAALSGADDAHTLLQLSFDSRIRQQVTFNRLNPATLRQISGRIAPGTPLNRLLARIGQDTVTKTADVLTDGIIRGRNVRVIGRELARAAELPRNRAMTIARTEIFGAYRDAHHEHFKANDDVCEGWIWYAQVESACGGCLGKHGDVIDDLDDFMPSHPNCQCEPMPKVKSFEDMGFDPALDDMMTDQMRPDLLKAQANQQISGASQEQLRERFGKGKGDLLHSGAIDISDMPKRVPNQTWGDAIIEKPLRELT
jgi:hypothetical protein